MEILPVVSTRGGVCGLDGGLVEFFAATGGSPGGLNPAYFPLAFVFAGVLVCVIKRFQNRRK